MSRQVHLLYNGQIKANKIGSFVLAGETFHIIRPGYDVQGKRRTTWTQVVHDDVPVFQIKVTTSLEQVIATFEDLFRRKVGDDPTVLARALDASKAEHRKKFMDGKTGEAPAPTKTLDGKHEGRRYPA